jgi:hypothetical protein
MWQEMWRRSITCSQSQRSSVVWCVGGARLQNLCGVAAPRSVGSTPAPLRNADLRLPQSAAAPVGADEHSEARRPESRARRHLRRDRLPLGTWEHLDHSPQGRSRSGSRRGSLPMRSCSGWSQRGTGQRRAPSASFRSSPTARMLRRAPIEWSTPVVVVTRPRITPASPRTPSRGAWVGVHSPYGQSHGKDPQVVADREREEDLTSPAPHWE